MPFLPPNQQRQSTEGRGVLVNKLGKINSKCHQPQMDPRDVLPRACDTGVTHAFTWVSMCQYTAISVPSVSLATVQGLIHGVYYGLGNGIGHLIGGLAIDAYGAPATFYAAAAVVILWSVLFYLCQKVCHSSCLVGTARVRGAGFM